jgi:hypothetical protein
MITQPAIYWKGLETGILGQNEKENRCKDITHSFSYAIDLEKVTLEMKPISAL